MGFIRMVLGDVSCFDDGGCVGRGGYVPSVPPSDHDIYTYAVEKEKKTCGM